MGVNSCKVLAGCPFAPVDNSTPAKFARRNKRVIQARRRIECQVFGEQFRKRKAPQGLRQRERTIPVEEALPDYCAAACPVPIVVARPTLPSRTVGPDRFCAKNGKKPISPLAHPFQRRADNRPKEDRPCLFSPAREWATSKAINAGAAGPDVCPRRANQRSTPCNRTISAAQARSDNAVGAPCRPCRTRAKPAASSFTKAAGSPRLPTEGPGPDV